MSRFLSKLRHNTTQPQPNLADGRPSTEPIHEKAATHLDEREVPLLTWRSVYMGVLVSMGGFVYGYDTGQISGFLAMEDFMRRFGQFNHNTQAYYFSNVRSGLIVGLLSIGTLIGALVAAPIADRIGRKWSIFWWCIIFHVGIIVQISASYKWYQIMIGRLIAGFGVGSLSLLVPMYQSESAPRQIRGALISTYQLFITIGIFVASCINYGTEARHNSGSWRIPMGISFLWALILGIGIIFFPDTPRYDYRHGRVDQARRTMAQLYGVPENHRVVVSELAEIQQKLEEEQKFGGQKWWAMFTGPRMMYRITLGVALQALQQLTGANYFFYYGTSIFKSVGIQNSFVTQMILNGVNFGTTFLGLYIIEHFGRRKSLIWGGVWMFICFMIFASVGHFSLDRNNPQSTPGAGKAMIVFACFFITGFASTWGPMVWTINAELYPSRYRAGSMAMATASNWLWNFLLAFFTPFIVGDIDFRYGYVFAGCLVLCVGTVYFFVIEGQGKTLEELDTAYILHVKPWKSASWVPPPPEQLLTTDRLVAGDQGPEAGNPQPKPEAPVEAEHTGEQSHTI